MRTAATTTTTTWNAAVNGYPSRGFVQNNRRLLHIQQLAAHPSKHFRRWHHLSRATGVRPNATSPWDDKPYQVLPSGKIAYIDEQDVVSFLDPPTELIPLDPSSYNPASYLWY